MKTIFDLRKEQEAEIYEAIQSLYDEPLKVVSLAEKSINECIGCWDCWLKTPGKCVMKDPMAEIYPDYINSDTVILLMDAAQGFINHKAKAFFDRSIPHYHPYIIIEDGECHHLSRYKSYPDMVFYYDTKGLTIQEENVIEDYLYRTAYQFKSKAYRIIKDVSLQLRLLESRKAKRQAVEFNSVEPMEKLVIYNGSPRRSGSNSTLILEKVHEVLGNKVEIRDLKRRDKWEEWAMTFKNEDHVMFFMPLYVHAMPSHLMKFMEKLEPSRGSISFFVQSGFPESSQSYYLEAYFQQLSLRLGRTYVGTAIKGGVEGLQIRPAKSQEKTIEPMVNSIVNLMSEGSFNQNDISQLAKPIKLGKGMEILFKVFSKLGLVNFFWNQQLKENNAYEKRFDCPYLCLNKGSTKSEIL
ncbi:multimeric flavodoxin WrbA [Sedimentibacter acidaminivorans]|uniref:Multimeric flavodoxin WrbA n=1 Tax=Sedimentibacter acidaminivorans TaxID=913099 RepID=A0ABS4GCG1_9FIRM|nr:flavodoxin family protein [Sedimentibacter acidaminivorans]MBP1925381.1 multimeric flavodoxin WrbA [Sedimentibacter acidaminivorans]